MPAEPRGGVAQALCRTLLRAATDLTDGQLLDRFLAGREEAAFEALVRRHGPMVFGVCRRVLGNAADADDAFQATFVVLVRKARSLADRGTVGDFLYGVAYHTALKARAQAVKRRAKEARAAVPDRPDVDPAERDELLKLLDRELARLPGKYREPVVLCDLEGRPRAEVGGLLGIPEGTLSSRLTTARRTLADRLGRHGLVVSAGVVAAALGRSAEAGVPGSLVGAAVRAAGGAVPAAVAHLASEVAKMMLLGKLKAGAMGFAVVTLLGAAIGLAAAPDERPAAKPEPPAKAAARPAAKSDEPEWRKEFHKVYGLADGEVLKRVPPPYPDSRTEFFKSMYGDPRQIPYEHHFSAFRWKNGRVEVGKSQLPVKPDEGATLATVLDFVADLSAQMVEGNPEQLNTRVTGDFVVRDGADPVRVAARLERILRDECKLPVALAFEHVEQDVVVARGKFASKPLEGRKPNHVEIYARSVLDPAQNGSGGSGPDTLPKLLQHLGSYINRRIVNEVEQPTGRVSWTNNLRGMIIRDPVRGIDTDAEDRDPDAVLRNVAAQTGLTFKTEKRTVRVLFVRKWDEKQEKARGHAEEAFKLQNARRYDEALAEYTRAIELDPGFEGAYFARSGIHASRPEVEKRDYKAAVGDLTTYLILQPNSYPARDNRASIYRNHLKEYDKAIADYDQIIADPTDISRTRPSKDAALAWVHLNRGLTYELHKQDYDKAIADYTEALRLDPKTVADMAFFHRAKCFRATKKYEEAAADFAKALERLPDNSYNSAVFDEWAWQLATCPDPKSRDGKKAVELADRARELTKGQWPKVLDTLAAAHAEAGNFARAVEWQTKAIGLLDPKAKEREGMQTRLKLYEAGKPYHEE